MRKRTLRHLNRENPDMYHHTIFRCRSAFTLVELLAVTMIIAILATFTTMAVNSSIQAAKEAKTRGTIQKLDTAIQQIYESYEEKFENLQVDAVDLQTFLGGPATPAQLAQAEAKIKLHFIRDIMRMEMPVTWNEIIDTNPPNPPPNIKLRGPIGLVQNSITFSAPEPGVCRYYFDIYNNHTIDTTKVPSHAELLFQIIMNLNPEALEGFHESEIGDLDGNGLFEFHDAWGTPIMFLRWAPAFAGSDRQPDIVSRSNYPLQTDGMNNLFWEKGPNDTAFVTDAEWIDPTTISDVTKRNVVSVMQQSVSKHHDPFDTLFQTRSWFLYPVVFSAGADKHDDYYAWDYIVAADASGDYFYTWSGTSQPILDPFELPNGLPNDNAAPDGSRRNNELNHYDNIHNHRIGGGF